MRSTLAWTPVAVVAAWTIVRGLGLERGYPLFPLIAYTPLVAAGAVLAAVLAAALRRRAPAVVALACALILGALVAPRALGGTDDAAGPSIGVLTVNTHFCTADAEAIVALARETGAEVVSLQELTPRGVSRLRAAGLAALLPHHVAQPRDVAVYATVPLERIPSPADLTKPVAFARAVFDGVPVEVAAVHPPAPYTGESVSGLRHDLPRLPPASGDALRILAGDFNSTLDHAALRELIDTGYDDAAERVGAGLKATWPADRRFPPPVTIDHVLVDERFGVRSLSVHEIAGTDHRALFAEIVLPQG